MKSRIALIFLFASMAVAQVSPPSTQSRVAGRFVAYNYGLWALPAYTMPTGTGSKTFTLSSSTVRMQDGRVIMPFATNAPLRVGTETVTVTAVGAGCLINSTAIGGCSITATFTLPHTVADPISSGTYGLQEALNDASASGGGTVTVDSAWATLGGTSGMVSAATIPSRTGIEDERTGPGSTGGSGTVGAGTTGQAAVYTGNGTTVAGGTLGVVGGGTGATTAAGALANLGGLPLSVGTLTGALNGTSASFSGAVAAQTAVISGALSAGPIHSSSPSVPGLNTVGDSIAAYVGATASTGAFEKLLAYTLGGLNNNLSVAGQYILDEPIEAFNAPGGPILPSRGGNPTFLEEGGKNDSSNCAGGSSCIANSQLAYQTIVAWWGSSNWILASAQAETGTWANDAVVSSCRATTTNGSTARYTITAYALTTGTPTIDVTFRTSGSNGGAASVSIDGAVVGNVTLNAYGETSYGTGSTMPSYGYAVSAGSHTVLITNTSATSISNVVAVCGVVSGNNPANSTYVSAPSLWSMEVIPYQSNANPTYTSTINAMKQSTIATMSSQGFNVVWSPIVNAPTTGAFNSTNYISNQPAIYDPDGLSCAGDTTDTVHPNNCGHKAIYQALLYDMAPNTGGAAATLSVPIYQMLGQNSQGSSYTLQATDGVVYFNCALSCTLTLPSGLAGHGPYYITNVSASVAVTVSATGTRIGIPTMLQPGQAIIITSTTYGWYAHAGPPSSLSLSQGSFSSNYTMIGNEGALNAFCSTACTLTVPTSGGPYFLSNLGTASVTFSGAGSYNLPSTLQPGEGIEFACGASACWSAGWRAASMSVTQTVQGSSYTLQVTDGIVLMNCSSACTLTLPSTLSKRGPFWISNIGGAIVTISGVSGTYNVPTSLFPGQAISLSSFAGNWQADSSPIPGAVTAAIGGSALVAGACASGTATFSTVIPLTTTVPVSAPNTYPGDGFTWEAYWSAFGTVTVKVCASIAGTPTASTYNVRVIQ